MFCSPISTILYAQFNLFIHTLSSLMHLHIHLLLIGVIIKINSWTMLAKVNQHPQTHHEGWMVTRQKNIIQLGSNSLTNHCNELNFYYLTTNNPLALTNVLTILFNTITYLHHLHISMIFFHFFSPIIIYKNLAIV
jgi:hypothetical protein